MRTKTIEFFPKQYEALTFKTQFGLVTAGVQSGKSHMGACWSAGKMQEKEETTGAIIAPSYKLLQQSTLTKFFGIFPQFRAFYKEQKGIIQIDNKTIFIRSADNPLSLEGMTLDWAWLDEAGMMPRLVWSVIRSRVSITRGQVLLTTTPYSLNWIYEDFYLPWKRKEDKSLSFYTWISTENPKFSKEIFEAEKKRLTPEEFARRYCGQFKKMEGLVYNFETIERKPFPKNTQYICGVDWGFSNPAAIVIIAITGNQFYIVDEWKETEKTTAEIIEVLANFISIYNIKYIYPDPAEPDRIKELAMSNITSQPVTKDIKGGISYIQQLIKENRISVFRSCQNFMDEANSYHYPTDRISDLPVKSNDHLCFIAGTMIFSNKGFIPIEKLEENHKVLTRKGYKDIFMLHNREEEVFEISLSNGVKLIATGDHSFWLQDKGIFFKAKDLKKNDLLLSISHNLWYRNSLYSKESNSEDIQTQPREQKEFITVPTQTISKKESVIFIEKYGKKLMDQFRKVSASITKTAIQSIMIFPIYNSWIQNCTCQFTQKNDMQKTRKEQKNILIKSDRLQKNGMQAQKVENGIDNMVKKVQITLNRKNISVYSAIEHFSKNLLDLLNSAQITANPLQEENQESTMKKGYANNAEKHSLQINIQKQDSVLVVAVRKLKKKQKVYNLSVEDCHEYYANGILVSNCDALRYAIFSFHLDKKEDATDEILSG